MSVRNRMMVLAAALGVAAAGPARAETKAEWNAYCLKQLPAINKARAARPERFSALDETACGAVFEQRGTHEARGALLEGLRTHDCFLTGACCETAGLADDCFELRVLRRFRDDVLAGMPGGREDIALYYDVAPRIAAALDGRALARIYAGTVLPCVALILLGAHRAARARYTRTVRSLMARYGVTPRLA